MHATILDLLGLYDGRAALPFGDRMDGASLVRPPPRAEPRVLLSTASGVWEPDDAKYGVMQGDLVAIRSAGGAWWCFDVRADPREIAPRGMLPGCAPLIALGSKRFRFQ